jgi:SAM-dependent methyltransferase
MTATPDHLSNARDQFTRQATAFASSEAVRRREALQLLVRLTGPRNEDTVLDVACGPGVVACAFAGIARHVTGIDLTPAMIERAHALQKAERLRNLTWQVGPAHPLPFPDAHFTHVVCRYAVHHFEAPGAVLHEMTRVCQPGGHIVLADVVVPDDPLVADAFNRMERLRDPSHVRALSVAEFDALGKACGLIPTGTTRYPLAMDLERLLAASFSADGKIQLVRQMFEDSLTHDRLGVTPVRAQASIRFAYPIAVFVWTKPSG